MILRFKVSKVHYNLRRYQTISSTFGNPAFIRSPRTNVGGSEEDFVDWCWRSHPDANTDAPPSAVTQTLTQPTPPPPSPPWSRSSCRSCYLLWQEDPELKSKSRINIFIWAEFLKSEAAHSMASELSDRWFVRRKVIDLLATYGKVAWLKFALFALGPFCTLVLRVFSVAYTSFNFWYVGVDHFLVPKFV